MKSLSMRTQSAVIIVLALAAGVATAHPNWSDRGSDDGSQSFLGDGWDGPGLNATTLYFHFRNAHPVDGPAQREIMIGVLEDWASVVQIHFVETPVARRHRCIEFLFAVGDHCGNEPAECGGPDFCVFNGTEPGGVAHAAYPPGIPTSCGGISAEPYAGDVHIDAEEAFRTGPNQNGWSLALITAHNVGHALGLTDHLGYTMDPNFTPDSNYFGIFGTDEAQIQQGYAPGPGSVTTLEDSGVWVNNTWQGTELGTPGNPFNSLAEGVAGVPPFGADVTVHVLGGLYPENLTISKPCVITSEFGSAIIGN